MEENKTYYLFVKGKKVEVSEEVYRAYVRPIRAQKMKEYRAKEDDISITSLDALTEKGFEVADERLTVEEEIVAEETEVEERETLATALASLNKRDRQIIQFFYYEGKTQVEIAEILGVSQAFISKKIKEILEKLKNFF